MENGSKLEKFTGFSQSTGTEKEGDSAQRKSMANKKESPELKNVHSPVESRNSIGEVSASEILAIQVLMGDFMALKKLLAGSWQVSNNGKIYWCADMPGHKLSIVNGNLLVDGLPVDSILEKLLAVK